MSNPKHYNDLGWANGWKEEPEIVRECQKQGHETRQISHDWYGLHNECICDICKYIYHYDSSG